MPQSRLDEGGRVLDDNLYSPASAASTGESNVELKHQVNQELAQKSSQSDLYELITDSLQLASQPLSESKELLAGVAEAQVLSSWMESHEAEFQEIRQVGGGDIDVRTALDRWAEGHPEGEPLESAG